jgi:hypothetical protein
MVPTVKGEAAASGSKARDEYLMIVVVMEKRELPQNTRERDGRVGEAAKDGGDDDDG